MRDGEEVAVCPSCSLQIRVIFEMVGFFSFSVLVPPRPPSFMDVGREGTEKKKKREEKKRRKGILCVHVNSHLS